nr:hypothetical protein BCV15_18325 [Vibrio cyclitrophicus]
MILNGRGIVPFSEAQWLNSPLKLDLVLVVYLRKPHVTHSPWLIVISTIEVLKIPTQIYEFLNGLRIGKNFPMSFAHESVDLFKAPLWWCLIRIKSPINLTYQ